MTPVPFARSSIFSFGFEIPSISFADHLVSFAFPKPDLLMYVLARRSVPERLSTF